MRVLIIGIDGASPQLLDKWEEHLPNLRRLADQGATGNTIPPIPPQTPVAWTTFITGTNPGKHGIFSFATRRQGTYRREIISPARIKTPTLPDILGRAGLTSGFVNTPMTPRGSVRGFTIPGFLARDEGTPKPNRIADRIQSELGLQKIPGDIETQYLKKVRDDPEALLNRAKKITEQLGDATLLLLEEEWDFFMTVFLAMDRVQHFFWKNIDDTHPQCQRNNFTERARDIMRTIDHYVGEIAEGTDEDTLLIVLSDHGFCPIHTEIYLNNYLEDKGLITRENGEIDDIRTKARAYGYGDIWINLLGREPAGTIEPGEPYNQLLEDLYRYLTSLKIKGEKPIKTVKRREEVYVGPETAKAPDLVTVFNPGWQAARQPDILPKGRGPHINTTPRWSGGHDGTHDPHDVPGILIINGPGTERRRDLRADLADLAPTILKVLGEPIPSHMDGQPLDIWD